MDIRRITRHIQLKSCLVGISLTVVTYLVACIIYTLTVGKTNLIWMQNSTLSKQTFTKTHSLKEYVVFSNEAWGEKFRVKLSLTSREQFEFVNKTKPSKDSDLFIPLKRAWTSEDRYTFEWVQLDLLSKETSKLLKDTKNPCWFDVHKVMRCVPYMYLIGAPKCGTTDLYERLLQHPDFTEPSQKEPHWISRKRLGRSINEDVSESKSRITNMKFADYLSNFIKLSITVTSERVENLKTRAVNLRITGDCSASTLWDNDIWTQLPRNDNPLEPVYTNPHYVFKLNPEAKIVVLLRDPVARLYSDYLYFLPGSIHKSQALFHHQVVTSVQIFTSCIKQYSLRSCVYNPQLNNFIPDALEMIALITLRSLTLFESECRECDFIHLWLRLRIGIYYIYLREWFEVFPRNQILALRTEDYAKNTSITVEKVYKFLGLKSLNQDYISSITRTRKKNTRKSRDESVGDMWPETKLLLNSFYSTFNILLETLLRET